MSEILLICTAVLFFFLGRWTRTIKKHHTDTIDDIVNKARIIPPSQTPKNPIKPGAIPYKTQEQIADDKSGDKALADHWEKTGVRKVLSAD